MSFCAATTSTSLVSVRKFHSIGVLKRQEKGTQSQERVNPGVKLVGWEAAGVQRQSSSPVSRIRLIFTKGLIEGKPRVAATPVSL